MELKESTSPSRLSPSELQAYERTVRAPFCYVTPNPGYLQITGPDRSDFLQRQTTNNLARLGPGQTIDSVLTTPAARILDVLILFESKDPTNVDEAIGILPLPGHSTKTLDYFRQRIFFMDKVTIQDYSVNSVQIQIGGPGSEQVLSAISTKRVPEESTFLVMEFDGIPIRMLRRPEFIGESFLILSPQEVAEALTLRLERAGAHFITQPVYEILRVEVGTPGPDTELTDDYTPLELGLDHTISEEKGCYTGQEVIARQITYDKVTQHLAGIKLMDPVRTGASIQVEGKKAGIVTSAIESPRYGLIALGVVRRPHHKPGTEIQIGDPDNAVSGQVVRLPFIDASL